MQVTYLRPLMLAGVIALMGCNGPTSESADPASPEAPAVETAPDPAAEGPTPPEAVLEDIDAIKADIAAVKEGEFVKACLGVSNLEKPICQCLSAKASERLTPDALKFLIATLKQDIATANTLKEIVPPTELAEAGMFMVNETANCAAPQFAPQ